MTIAEAISQVSPILQLPREELQHSERLAVGATIAAIFESVQRGAVVGPDVFERMSPQGRQIALTEYCRRTLEVLAE